MLGPSLVKVIDDLRVIDLMPLRQWVADVRRRHRRDAIGKGEIVPLNDGGRRVSTRGPSATAAASTSDTSPGSTAV
jgi:hypothetical protein